MKRFVTICAAIGAGLLATSFALADEPQLAPPSGAQPATSNDAPPVVKRGKMASYFDVDAQTKHNDANVAPASNEEAASTKSGCSCESNSCGSESPCCGNETTSCGSEAGCCSSCGCNDNWCDLGLDCYWPFTCCCKPGDPCTLQKHLTPCCHDVTYGGFFDVGYYSQNTGLSANDGDLLDTHDYPGRAQLSQFYYYVEKKAKTDSCCCDWGYRWDIMYGTEAFAGQANGNSNNGWDKDWDHGNYFWAMPQAYVEVGVNDWSIKMGHFYTIVGYEVLPATGNFFYSHSLSWFNSEPVTHTGVLGTYTPDKCNTYYAGYTLGWDTAFDAFDGGSNYIGGVTHKFNDNLSLSYLLTVGNFGFRSDGEFGYEHTIILDAKLSKKWEYVMENDIVETDGSYGGTGVANDGEDFEIANYLFYTINDCWKMGTRFEWWKSNQVTGQDASFYELTYGFNYKANANLMIRPEVRYDWTPGENAVVNAPNQNGNFYDKVIFGIDAVLTF
jgi:hypothetical protein